MIAEPARSTAWRIVEQALAIVAMPPAAPLT